MSIRFRLILGFLILNGFFFFYLTDWVRSELRPRYLEGIEDSLIDFANVLAAMVENSQEQGGNPNIFLQGSFDNAYKKRFEAKIYDVVKANIDLRVYVTDAHGIVVFDSKGKEVGADFSQWNDIVKTLRGEYGARATRTNTDDPFTSVMHVSAPIIVDKQIKGVLTVAKPPETMNIFIHAAQKRITLIGVASALVFVALIIFITFVITKPILRLKDYASLISEGQNPPKPVLAPRELSELAQAFEHMRETLEGKLYIENYVQNLTHEIKGPLTGIRSASELLQETMTEVDRTKFLKNIATETARLQDIADRLLNLSEIERSKELVNCERVELGALIDELTHSIEATLKQRQLSLKTHVDSNLVFWGDEFLLTQAISNLLQNAMEFASQGTAIEVTARNSDLRHVELSVEDVGSQIPDYALPRVFERFYSLPRASTGRKSSGLGLAFVQEIARLHGGRARIENTQQGVRVILKFLINSPLQS